MNELLLVGGIKESSTLLDIKPTEPPGATSVMDEVSRKSFYALSGSTTVVTTDGDGDQALLFSGSHFENPSVDLGTKNNTFSVSFDVLLTAYPSAEGALFSQLSAQTGAGTFAITMVGSGGRVSFYWCRDGSLSSRDSMVSSISLPLNTYTRVIVQYDKTKMSMYFNDTLVASKDATQVYSAALPLGIGGHYNTDQYNSRGTMKNLIVSRTLLKQ